MIHIKLWYYRNLNKVTLVKLSEMTGISKSSLSRIENMVKSPTLDQLEKIAKALDVQMTDLYKQTD